jgi:hypothetical protein
VAWLPVLAVATVWLVIVVVRARRAVRSRADHRQWTGAMTTLGRWSSADRAGEPWCQPLATLRAVPAPRMPADDAVPTAEPSPAAVRAS